MTKNFYQCRIQERSHLYGSTVSKALDSFKFQSFNIHSLAFNVGSPASRVQHPGFRVQHPESSVQSPASRVQGPESSVQRPWSSVQSPTSNSCVQSPGIPVCCQIVWCFCSVSLERSRLVFPFGYGSRWVFPLHLCNYLQHGYFLLTKYENLDNYIVLLHCS